jgi:hypothetical protein
MKSSVAKLKALRNRIISIGQVHRYYPAVVMNSIIDEFKREVALIEGTHSTLAGFAYGDYEKGLLPDKTKYFPYFGASLIGDIDYFLTYLEELDPIGMPAVVSEEGVYLAGQHFDALLKFSDIISKATSEIVLVDGYLNEKILELLASKNSSVKCRVLTKAAQFGKPLQTFVEAFNKQHGNLEVCTTEAFHDRFVVIDQLSFYHFGASIKDAGKKGFMYSKLEEPSLQRTLWTQIEAEWKP